MNTPNKFHRILLWGAVFYAITVTLPSLPLADTPKKIGQVIEITGEKGKLSYQRDQKNGFLNINAPLFFKDWLFTDSLTKARLRLGPDPLDGTPTHGSPGMDLFLHENSKLLIESQILRPKGITDFVTELSEGLLKVIAKGLSFEKRLFIYTPHSLIGIRGSTLWIGILTKQKASFTYVILKKGAKVFSVPLKNHEPIWEKGGDLPATEDYTTVIIGLDGEVDRIFPYFMESDRIKLYLPDSDIVESLPKEKQELPQFPDPTQRTQDKVDEERLKIHSPPRPAPTPAPPEF